MSRLVALYNDNVFIHLCIELSEGFSQINEFISKMRSSGNLKSRNKLINIYSSIFEIGKYSTFFKYEVERVIKPHYSRFSGNEYILTEGNSSYHILLKIADIDLLELDRIYNYQLTGLLRMYKNMFSIIDAPEHELTQDSLKKREVLIQNLLGQMQLFLDSVYRRDEIKAREKLENEIIMNIPYNGFYHLTHISNLKSIVEKGILSRNKLHLQGIMLSDISNTDIQNKRMRPESIYGRMIHDYVPLYINPKNPFLNSTKVRNTFDNIVLIEIYPHILVQQEKTLFSDGNAAEKETNFFGKKNDLEKVNWTLLQNGKWSEDESKRVMCSEVLIPDVVNCEYIQKIFINNYNNLEEVMKSQINSLGIKLEINNNLFNLEYEFN
jgi:hypothetical protein